MLEVWKVIETFPNYDVSNTGRVRRNCKGRGTFAGRELKLTITKMPDGYRQVRIGLWHNGKKHTRKVAQLVLLAFSPEKRRGRMAMHLDDNPLNNWYSNLKWGTNGQNQRHRWQNRKLCAS